MQPHKMETSRRYRLHDHDDAADDLQEDPSTCLFFCFPCPLRRRQHGGLEHRSLLSGEPPWWEEGPPRPGDQGLLAKWLALLRRLGRHGGGRKRRPQQQLQYDPVSYALNFDDGAGRGEPAGPPFLAGFSPGPPSKGSYI